MKSPHGLQMAFSLLCPHKSEREKERALWCPFSYEHHSYHEVPTLMIFLPKNTSQMPYLQTLAHLGLWFQHMHFLHCFQYYRCPHFLPLCLPAPRPSPTPRLHHNIWILLGYKLIVHNRLQQLFWVSTYLCSHRGQQGQGARSPAKSSSREESQPLI